MPASAAIGNLAVNLTMETAAFERGASLAEKRAGMLGKKFDHVGKRFAQFGTIAAAGLTLPLVAFGKHAFSAASDAAELQSAFDQTFGNMAGSMNKWAEATGNAMGRSTQELQKGAQTFGLYFNQLGKTRTEAANMSKTFTVLAQDLASFHNTSGEQAIAALRSGLSGESEPLRQFGVFLSDAAVNAKAAELGIGALGEKLTDQEKIAARYALIMEATKNAQGDVARTSDSAANQIKKSQAAWEEIQVTIGTKLLPALTPLIEALGKVLDKFNHLSPTTQSWIVGIGAAAAALGPFMLALGPMIIAFGKLLPLMTGLIPIIGSFGRAILALAIAGGPLTIALAAVAAIYTAWQNWDSIEPIIRRVVTAAKTWLVDKFNAVVEGVKSKIRAVRDAFQWLGDQLVFNSIIPDLMNAVAAQFARLRQAMVEPALQATKQVMNAFGDLTAQGVNDFATAIADAALGTKSLAASFKDMAKSIIHQLIQMTVRMLAFRAIAGMMGGFGGGIGAGLPGGLSDGSNALYGGLGVPGMARGGSGIFGGFSGIDRNVLSMNGSPIARVSKGEKFSVSPANARGSTGNLTVNVNAKDAVLTSSVKQWVAEGIAMAAPKIMQGAQQGVFQTMNRRRLP